MYPAEYIRNEKHFMLETSSAFIDKGAMFGCKMARSSADVNYCQCV
jgi:hypothetical protein